MKWITTLLAVIGMILLVSSVLFNDPLLRILWLLAGVFLAVYNLLRKDWVNMSVNWWIVLINLLKLFCVI